MRDELINVYADSHAELLGQSFFTIDRYWERVESYLRATGFDLVAGRIGDQLIGYTFGSPLPTDTQWWSRLRERVEPALIHETGSRTFAVREFMVRKDRQGQGHGHALHDELLRAREEDRATLLVRTDNPARELYLRWGWTVVGTMQPFPDSPIMEAMIRPLEPDSGSALHPPSTSTPAK